MKIIVYPVSDSPIELTEVLGIEVEYEGEKVTIQALEGTETYDMDDVMKMEIIPE